MRVGVIINPIAGGGGLVRQRPAIEAELARHFDETVLRETQGLGDAAHLAREFAAAGFGMVIAAGGDGTASEVADGLLDGHARGGRMPELGILPCGTGADFSRGLGLGADLVAVVNRIALGKAHPVDAGRVCYVDDHGALACRHFLNIASLGLSGATDRAVNADRRKGKGSAKALFLWRTVVEFLRYRFQDVRIAVDDGEPVEARVALVAAANGRFFGGGMMIAPDAEIDDGLLDIVVVRASGKAGLIWDLRLLYGGRHRDHHAITIQRGRKVTVEPLGGRMENFALVDIDGESPGRIPATFEIIPGVLRLRY